MKETGYVVLGLVVGVAVGSLMFRAQESSCCQRVALGARDKIAGYTGPFSGAVGGILDATGLTNLLPGLLDAAGVPKDA
jgi:hypothetical protein